MSEDIFTNEALADEALSEQLMSGDTLGLPIEEIAAAEAGYPVVPEEFAAAPVPTIDVPHFEPIHLTEQIPLEYAGPRVDLPIPMTAGQIDWSRLPKRPISRTPRPSTIVWGFLLLASGLGLIASELGHPVDFGLGMIWLLAAAGVSLVTAAVISELRRKTA